MELREKLIEILIRGRNECYVKKSAEYNPYVKSSLYDWEFRMKIDEYVFTDSYRGFNPYSGVEYVYDKEGKDVVWFCDYVGYVNDNEEIPAEEIYRFLKESRKNHLMNSKEHFFDGYRYEKGLLVYITSFNGNLDALLQMENFYYKGTLIAQQISSGKLK